MRLINVTNPGSKRAKCFHDEVNTVEGRDRIDIVEVAWADIIDARGRLEALSVFEAPAAVRFGSPGGDDSVGRALLRLAAELDPNPFDVSAAEADYLPSEIRPHAQLHAGLRWLTEVLSTALDARPDLNPWTPPKAIATMLDKQATRLELQDLGIPTPDGLDVTSAEEIDMIRYLRGWRKWFVKLRFGSCGSGIARLTDTPDDIRGLTSVGIREGRYVDIGRLRPLNNRGEVEATVTWLAEQGAVLEPAIELARVDGLRLDLRVVVIRNGPAIPIFRQSRHPITNLFLGGRRADLASSRQAVGQRRYLDALDLARAAAESTGAHVVGVDVLFDAEGGGVYVLELNPFGDFFPGWTDDRGQSIAALALQAWRS